MGYVKPDHIDKYDNMDLSFACQRGMIEVALELIKTGKFNPDYIDHNGNTAFMLVCYHNKYCKNDLMEYYNNMKEVALELIKTGHAKPEYIDKNGNTALMCACMHGIAEVALELIKTGNAKPEH